LERGTMELGTMVFQVISWRLFAELMICRGDFWRSVADE
jgi:hypothetical protein